MIAFKAVAIVRNGRSYSGSYLIDGRTVAVGSAYGSKGMKLAKG